MDGFTLTPAKVPHKALAFTNFAYVHPATYEELKSRTTNLKAALCDAAVRCEIKTLVLNVKSHAEVLPSDIGVNTLHRSVAKIDSSKPVVVKPWSPELGTPLADLAAQQVECEIGTASRTQRSTVKEETLEAALQSQFKDHVFTVGQVLATRNPTDGVDLLFTVSHIHHFALQTKNPGNEPTTSRGIVMPNTEFVFTVANGFNVAIESSKTRNTNLFRPDFDFEQLGVGGLDREFADIFRRAFASRIFPPQVIKELGIQHVRGMLLYGPPGTGKTLIARQIGNALRARQPKIVNGPEILNKYVGQSEENIRALFKEAEEEYKKKGDASSLHIIIFDEIDAICKQRGSVSSGTGVNDSIVNQLLSKIDGVDALNNILLIGMTNRLDMIDEALLRPGRLEVHMEIGLPDLNGRIQILNIHTHKMREFNRLDQDVSLVALAEKTRNFSGAEIAGLVRSAASYAFARKVDVKDLAKPTDVSSVQLCQADFECALNEITPAFGVQLDELAACIGSGIIEYCPEFRKLMSSLSTFAQQVRDSSKTPLLSCLLVGRPGTGKTALAAHIARVAEFPFVKLVSPEHFVGFTELSRVTAIKAAFEDAYKSKLSIIILDNLERLLDYTTFGNRFSNMILQALLVLVKKTPRKEGHRLFVLATSSESVFMEESGMAAAFHVVMKVPLLSATSHIKAVLTAASSERNDFPEQEIDEVCHKLSRSLPIKQLLLVYEMASEASRSEDHIRCEKFLECLREYGL